MPFHFCSVLLAPGSIILPGNWGRIVRLVGNGHPEWKREVILERIRQAEFSHLPSRWECVFFSETLAEAEYYGAARGKTPMILYEVELVEPNAPKHVADWKGTSPYTDGDEWARRYWRGDVMPGRGPAPAPLCREVLAVTALRILHQV